MAVTQGMSNAAKYDALNLAIASGDTIKAAFYTAGISATTAAYTATSEATNGSVVPAGGITLASRSISASDGSAATAGVTFADATVTPTTTNLVFQQVLFYNSSRSNRALGWVDYGASQTWNAGTTYTLDLPATATLLTIG